MKRLDEQGLIFAIAKMGPLSHSTKNDEGTLLSALSTRFRRLQIGNTSQKANPICNEPRRVLT